MGMITTLTYQDTSAHLQVEHSNANNIVNFEIHGGGLPKPYHVVSNDAGIDIVAFSYNGPPIINALPHENFLISLNCYWIYVPVDKGSEFYPTYSSAVPEPSTGLILLFLLPLLLLKRRILRRI